MYQPIAESTCLKPDLCIKIDNYGVPEINAGSDKDVFLAMGYLHAKDRLWQLEIMQRTASGSLSELLGEDALSSDIWMRSLQLYNSANSAFSSLSPDAKSSLEAYAEGVNTWINEKHLLPPEFKIFGISPHKWTAIDSLAWMKIFALNLSHNFNDEITQAYAAEIMSSEQFKAIFGKTKPSLKADAIGNNYDGSPKKSFSSIDFSGISSLTPGLNVAGSNAFTVAGRLTKDGASILANDPHLELQMPSIWYVVKQRGKVLRSVGMSLVGLPVVVFGRNNSIAWGGTSMIADVQDLFVESPKPDDPNLYKFGEHWERFQKRVEKIIVKPRMPAILRDEYPPVMLSLRTTRHGPVITDTQTNNDQVLSLSWVGLQGGDTTYEALFNVNYAKDWRTFRAALSQFVTPAINFVFIDKDGNIGFQGAGKIPVRSGYRGDFPVQGSDATLGWHRYIPYDKMPYEFNPPRGYIVSANNRNVPEDYPYLISNKFASPARAQRISELIEDTKRRYGYVSIEAIKQIQNDLTSLPARRLLPLLLNLPPQTQQQSAAINMLKKWDGRMTKDSSAASIFNVWMRHFVETAFVRPIQFHWNKKNANEKVITMVKSMSNDQIFDILTKNPSVFCLDKTSQIKLPCHEELLSSLNDALEELEKLRGSKMDEWTWGSIHSATFSSVPFSAFNGIKEVYQRKISTGGTPDTVNVANYDFHQSVGYVQSFGPTFRQIVKLRGQGITHLYINSTGQSGSPFYRHYDDMLPLYENGSYLSLSIDHIDVPSNLNARAK